MIPFGDLSRQPQDLRTRLDRAWKRVSRSGWFVLGREVAAFEKEFARYVGTREAVGVANGTEAIQLTLLALGVGPGHEVITVPNTAVPTASAISATGAVPVFVDIDPNSYTMDVSQVEGKITSRTRVLLPVHLFGHPADMDPLIHIARRYGFFIVEDACQAHGAEYRGKKVGSLGDIGCFSFYPSKNLGAYGDGGMVVTNNRKLARRLKLLRNYGQEERYHHIIQGFNSRLDELQAALLREKLKKLDAWNRRRRQLANLYSKGLSGLPLTPPNKASWARHCFHLYVIRLEKRKELMQWLARHGIQTLIHYPIPIHLQKCYRDLGLPSGSYPVSEQFSHQILSLPLYPELRDREQSKVIRSIRRFFGK